jgi:SAM-dependent methyltransferase
VSGFRRLAERVLDAVDRAAFPSAKDASEHWQREAMNDVVEDWIAALDPPRRSAAEISGDLRGHHGWGSYAALNYPEFDLCEPLTESRRFDVVICEQVLEHVPDPAKAVENLRELCEPGGHLLVSTPFLIKVHELEAIGMLDYWRFTPRGLRTLLERGGLEVEQVGAWGNRMCVVGNFSDWSRRRRWHMMRNESDFPVQVWAFARRPS